MHDIQAKMFLQRGRVRPASYVKELLEFMPRHVGTLLDLGCGAGEFALSLAERADFVVGLDPSAYLLDAARERQQELARKNVGWVLAPAEQLPFRSAAFDFIVSVNVLRLTDIEQVLSRLKQLLKPGGRLAIKDHLRTPEPFGFWAAYLWRLVRSTPSWVRQYGLQTVPSMLQYRLSPEGIAINKQSESLTAERFNHICKNTLPDCRVITDAHSGLVLWERTATNA